MSNQQRDKPPKKAKKQTNEKPSKSKCEGIKDQYKGFDWFGQTVQLTYKGEDQYRTLIGASVSFVLILILLGFGIFKAYYLFSRFNPEVTKVSLLRDMSLGEVFDPSESDFDFAFGLNSPLDPSIGYFTVRQLGRYETDARDATGKAIIQKTRDDIPYGQCGEEGFVYPNTKELRDIGIMNLNCVKNKTYQIQGNFYQKKFEYLELKLWKCINATSAIKCKDKTTIDNYFDKETFNFAFINNYFDLTEFEEGNQIKPFIDDSLFYELDSTKIKKANFYIQSQEAELEDDLIQFGQSKVINFHQVSNIKTYDDNYSDADGYVAAIYMRFDNKFDSYSRKVYSILELLGDIGGLQGSLMAIGFVFVGFISSKMFYSDIMHKIYQVRKYVLEEPEEFQERNQRPDQNGNDGPSNNDDANQPKKYSKKGFSEDAQTKGKPTHMYTNSITERNQILKSEISSRDNVDPEKFSINQEPNHDFGSVENSNNNTKIVKVMSIEEDIRMREKEQQKVFRTKKKVNEQDVSNLLVSFVSRMRFKYDLKCIFDYVTQCLCVRNLSKKRNQRYYKKHYIFQKGEEKMNQELDVIQLVKTLRKFKLLSQAMLSQNNRMLLRFQRQNLIETASESSDSDDNNLDTMNLMENKNPLIRLVVYGKLKKMMKQYQGKKLKFIERNLMRGVFQRKLKDFQEELQDQAENRCLLDRLKSQMIESHAHVEEVYVKDNMKRKEGFISHDELSSSRSSIVQENVDEFSSAMKLNHRYKPESKDQGLTKAPSSTISQNEEQYNKKLTQKSMNKDFSFSPQAKSKD